MYITEYLIKGRYYLILTYMGVLTFFLGSTLAIINHPSYSITNQWLSDLGTGENALLFNSTLIITGVLTSLFYPFTFYLLRQTGYSRTKSTAGMILGVTSFIFLIMVGIFSLDNDIYNIHSISTMAFLVSTSMAQLLLLSGYTWYIGIHLASNATMDSRLSYLSFIMAVFFGFLFVGGITFEQFILQKMTIYLLVITVLYQSLKVWETDVLFKHTT